MDYLEYKGYKGSVEYSREDNCLMGKVQGMGKDLIAYEGQTLDELRQDNTKMSTMWDQVFLKRENNTKTDYIASIVTNGIVAFDTFMLIRKLMKGYGILFGKKKKQKKSFL